MQLPLELVCRKVIPPTYSAARGPLDPEREDQREGGGVRGGERGGGEALLPLPAVPPDASPTVRR